MTAARRWVETLLTTPSRIPTGGVSASCGSRACIAWRSSPLTARGDAEVDTTTLGCRNSPTTFSPSDSSGTPASDA